MVEENSKYNVCTALRNRESVEGAFNYIIDNYSEALYWHLRRIVIRHEQAEDLLQDTFVTAYEHAADFRADKESSMRSWLYAIATSLAIKALKRRKRGIFTSIDSVAPVLLTDFEEEVSPSADEIAISLQRAVVKLPIKQKLVFNLRYYDELPFEQISKITGQSVSTLKANYHYAVKKIKNEVQNIEL